MKQMLKPTLLVLAALGLGLAAPVLARDGMQKAGMEKGSHCAFHALKGVDRTVANTATGVTVTFKAKDAKRAEKVQSMLADCEKAACPHCPMHQDGVTHAIQKTADGAVLTFTAADPNKVKDLQTLTADWSKKGCGGDKCPMGHHGAGQAAQT